MGVTARVLLCPHRVTLTMAEDAAVDTEAENGARFNSYLLLFNVGKKANFGQLLRSAMAFGVAQVGIVGAKKISELSLFGNQGTSNHANIKLFDSLEDALQHFKIKKNADICGIEIVKGSRPICKIVSTEAAPAENVTEEYAPSRSVCEFPFVRNTCFMLGNEGAGMNEQQMAVCDYFVHIPQYTKKTASLNVLVAGSIVLQYFGLWAAMDATQIIEQKFEMEKPRMKVDRWNNPTAEESEEITRKREERQAKKRKLAEGSQGEV